MADERTVRVIRSDATYVGKQGLTYALGITAQTAGSRGLCVTAATMPPGARARAHYHDGIETAGYMVAGASLILYGERLEHALVGRAGDYFFIPAGLPHAPFNHTDAPCTFVVAHSAGDDQAGIVMCPHLDANPVPEVGN
jgi:uncharacterized RmlC-like cupin family protein